NRLSGGEGADRFRFDALGAGNESRILDFAEGEDRIELDGAVFAALGSAGPLAAEAFGLGTSAGTAGQHVLYDQGSGALFYDADGAGGANAIRIGSLAQGTSLSAADVWVA
ncbi:hypothetical protein SAMN02745194_04064, partial [Roseomonas rosea]